MDENIKDENIKRVLDEDNLPYYTTKMKEYIAALLVKKVDKEDEKGLSQNDYTDEEKEKLTLTQAGLEATKEELNNMIKIVISDTTPDDTNVLWVK